MLVTGWPPMGRVPYSESCNQPYALHTAHMQLPPAHRHVVLTVVPAPKEACKTSTFTPRTAEQWHKQGKACLGSTGTRGVHDGSMIQERQHMSSASTAVSIRRNAQACWHTSLAGTYKWGPSLRLPAASDAYQTATQGGVVLHAVLRQPLSSNHTVAVALNTHTHTTTPSGPLLLNSEIPPLIVFRRMKHARLRHSEKPPQDNQLPPASGPSPAGEVTSKPAAYRSSHGSTHCHSNACCQTGSRLPLADQRAAEQCTAVCAWVYVLHPWLSLMHVQLGSHRGTTRSTAGILHHVFGGSGHNIRQI